MTQATERQFLPALLGALHQEGAEGELILEQNDGTRRLFWAKGDLVYLQSDAAGEQFGNYLIRQGILDHSALQELLAAKDDTRFGDRVLQWGLMTVEERDRMLQSLLEQVLLHALEHPVLSMVWEAGPIHQKLSADLRFRLDHRRVVWEAFQQVRDLSNLVDLLYAESEWRWESQEDLLVSLSDLSLTPEMAYALSLLGGEPIGFDTFMSVTGMEEDPAARLIATLWALGSLTLARGRLPQVGPGHAGGGAQKNASFSTGQMPTFQNLQSGALPPPMPPSMPPPPPPPAPRPPVPTSWSSIPPPAPMAPPPATPAIPPPPPSPQGSVWGTLPERPGTAPASLPPLSVPAFRPEPQEAPLPMAPQPQVDDPFLDRQAIFDSPAEVGDPGDESPLQRARRFVRKAKAMLVQERTAEAIRTLEDAVRLDPDSRQAFEDWLLLGRLRQTNPAWANRAVEALQQATRINPLAAEPWALIGEVYHRKGFKTNAITCFKKALELDPSVTVPADLDFHEPQGAAKGESEGAAGLLGRIKGLFGK